MWPLLSLLAALLLLAACTVPPTPLPTATATATSVVPSPAVTLSPTPAPSPIATALVRAEIGGHAFLLEVADTPEEKARGLMGRPSLPREAGMLFVYEEEQPLTFWMKDTLIALDILFLDGAGRVVDVQSMEPEPGVSDNVLRRYTSRRPARYAIEVNAGLAAEYGITVGTVVWWRSE